MRVRGPTKPAHINIKDEPVFFTQSDMDASNFGVDQKGNICLFDFEEVGLLPESFSSYTMCLGNFACGVAAHLGWPRSPHMDSMAKVARYLHIIASPGLGTSTTLDMEF